MPSVYWLHLYEHCEPDKEGYIGVSQDPKNRIYEHFRKLKNGTHENIHLTHAYLRYKGRIIHSIIAEGDDKYCYEVETKLRPKKAVGWNIAEGGFHGPGLEKGIPKTEEHKQNMRKPKASAERIGRYERTEEIRKKYSLAKLGEKNPRFGKPAWNRGIKQ